MSDLQQEIARQHLSTHRYTGVRRGRPAIADVYTPRQAKGTVMLVHGGAFVIGSRRMTAMRRLAQAFVARGLAVFSIDYRLIGRGGRFDASLQDTLTAMAWWRQRAPDFGVTDGRLGLLGCSAGAALAAIAASEGGADALVGVYGAYDFERLPGQPLVRLPTRLLLQTTREDVIRKRSPVNRANAPIPTLLFHGERDRLVPIRHAHALQRAREAKGLPVELETFADRHGYLQRDTPAAAHTIQRAADFFVDHLQSSIL